MVDEPDDGAGRPGDRRAGGKGDDEPPLDFGIDDLVQALQKVPSRAAAERDAGAVAGAAAGHDATGDLEDFDEELADDADDAEFEELAEDEELADDEPLADDEELEELGDDADVVEPPEDPTHPRRLFLTVGDRTHVVATDRFVIGRVSSQCDLVIVDANVSRQHCAIVRRDGVFFACDLGSTNGIEVRGVKVDDHPIAEGDVLVLSGHQVACSFEPPMVEVEPSVVTIEPVAPSPRVMAGPTGRLPAVAGEPVAAAVPIARASIAQAPIAAAPIAAAPIAQAHAPSQANRGPAPVSGSTAVAAIPTHADPSWAGAPGMGAPGDPRHAGTMDFETRVELRLEHLAQEVAVLRAGLERLVRHVESLEGIDALARLIQRRLQQAKRR